MNENDSEKEQQEPGPVPGNEESAQNNSAESLHEKLRSMASENESSDSSLKSRPSHEIFRVQEKIAEKKSTAKKIAITAFAGLLAVCIGYPAKLAYEGKIEVKKLTSDYKSLQIVIAAVNQRNYELYRKIFPQVEELQSSKLDSALKGIEENIDLAAKMNMEADDLWRNEKYDEAMKLYDHASKINPLNDRSVYLVREADLAKYDQVNFKRVYIVQKGDTLERLAKRAKVSVERIQNANGPKYAVLYQGRLIKGMRLVLPVDINPVR